MEFPQTGGPFLRHFEGSPNSPMHLYPSSIRQVLPQPSPGTVLPSSQDSPTSPMLLPQTGWDLKQTELVPRHWKPGVTLQSLEQPTPFLLSHSSVPSTIPLPHKEHTEGVPTTALQLKPVSTKQLEVQPSLPPLSHCSPGSTMPSGQIGCLEQREEPPMFPMQS